MSVVELEINFGQWWISLSPDNEVVHLLVII